MEESKLFYHRNLPHWHPAGRAIFLTWRLHGSLPQTVVNEMRILRHHCQQRIWSGRRKVEYWNSRGFLPKLTRFLIALRAAHFGSSKPGLRI